VFRRFMLFLVVAAMACAGDYAAPTDPGSSPPPPPPPPPPADVRLKDMEVAFLPSPYYRFEYDSAGKVTFASFASDLRTYEIQYVGNRISGMVSTRFVREQLSYVYDEESGKVTAVTYADSTGVYVRLRLTYAGDRLVTLERERRLGQVFQPDKRLSFAYDSRGNLAELMDERLPFPGQTASTFVDVFERYDDGINVDGFTLIHNEFFDHLVLLPGVRLQIGNPGGVTRHGDGINFHIDYTYTYDSSKRPIAKHGEGVLMDGTTTGQRFQTSATFAYQ
jgi:hypothetical protein